MVSVGWSYQCLHIWNRITFFNLLVVNMLTYAYLCSQDVVVGERDYLRQELGMFLEQIGHLEKENAALSQELEEKKDTEEFKSLEEEFRKEHEVTSCIQSRQSMYVLYQGFLFI